MIGTYKTSSMKKETIIARMSGLRRLYDDGAPAEHLWGYCACGNVVTDRARYDRGMYRLVLEEWDAAMSDFVIHFPKRTERRIVFEKCMAMLRNWSLQIEPPSFMQMAAAALRANGAHQLLC